MCACVGARPGSRSRNELLHLPRKHRVGCRLRAPKRPTRWHGREIEGVERPGRPDAASTSDVDIGGVQDRMPQESDDLINASEAVSSTATPGSASRRRSAPVEIAHAPLPFRLFLRDYNGGMALSRRREMTVSELARSLTKMSPCHSQLVGRYRVGPRLGRRGLKPESIRAIARVSRKSSGQAA